jgi:hypothetical protein
MAGVTKLLLFTAMLLLLLGVVPAVSGVIRCERLVVNSRLALLLMLLLLTLLLLKSPTARMFPRMLNLLEERVGSAAFALVATTAPTKPSPAALQQQQQTTVPERDDVDILAERSMVW